MNKKSFFIICSTLIIASNLLMISVVNKGEETGGNLFVIAIACVLLPAFLYAVENRLTSMVRVESILLIQLTVISLLRLINRIGSTPEILNIIITLIALASGTAAILVAIMRIYENIRKWGWVVFYFVFSHCQVPQGKYVFHACFLNFLTIQDVLMTIYDLSNPRSKWVLYWQCKGPSSTKIKHTFRRKSYEEKNTDHFRSVSDYVYPSLSA